MKIDNRTSEESARLREPRKDRVSRKRFLSTLQSAIPSHPLNFAGLSSFCNDINAINEEFAGIPQVSAKIDELPAGAEVKNRYANVIPLPETRVLLQKINNDPLTEYINASYVRVSSIIYLLFNRPFLAHCLCLCSILQGIFAQFRKFSYRIINTFVAIYG